MGGYRSTQDWQPTVTVMVGDGSMEFIILRSLLLCVFEIFHNKKNIKQNQSLCSEIEFLKEIITQNRDFNLGRPGM